MMTFPASRSTVFLLITLTIYARSIFSFALINARKKGGGEEGKRDIRVAIRRQTVVQDRGNDQFSHMKVIQLHSDYSITNGNNTF